MSTAISIQNLSKAYHINHQGALETYRALDNLNLEIKEGSITGIIGPNGAGKSTLLKILSRITYPTQGSISIQGKLASLLEVGTGFHPELSGRENIFLNGTILGMARNEIKAKFDEIVDFSGIEKFIDTPIKHYSSGMFVRLAFSVAANLTPDILLIDEVLAVGDAEFQRKCLDKMDQAKKEQGRTVVFVSHNMSAVRELCETVHYLEKGKILKTGSANEVTDFYLNRLEKKAENQSLSDRDDRKGHGEVLFQSLQWETGNDLLISGQPATLKINYDSHQLETIANLNLRLNIFNSQDHFITSLSNEMAGFPLTGAPAKGEINCHIPSLPLMAGKYYLKANLFANNIKSDRVEKALVFTVHEGDFYQSGDSNIKNKQGAYIPQSWTLLDS